MQSRTYLAIDLKSFYASVECRAVSYTHLIDDAVVDDGGFVLKVVAGADLIQNFDNFFSHGRFLL